MNKTNNKEYKKVIAVNRRARFDYHISDKFEAGLVLLGTEVKSLRIGGCSLLESYIDKTPNNELELVNANIEKYKFASTGNHEEKRNRKLLLNKTEIVKIINAISKKGNTCVPLQIYFKDGKVKLEIGLAKGKSLVDKRQTIKDRDIKKEQSKSFKDYNIKY